jgi:hypothetical protein
MRRQTRRECPPSARGAYLGDTTACCPSSRHISKGVPVSLSRIQPSRHGCDHHAMSDEIVPRSRLSWLAIFSRLGAVVLACTALLAEGQSPRWILLACAAGLAILPIAWRRKAAAVPGAIFATSADYLPGGPRRGQFPGELSVTETALTWNPSRHSIAKGFPPLTLAMDDCAAITMRGAPALFGVMIAERRRVAVSHTSKSRPSSRDRGAQ